ncbi:beta-glucosidase [Streptoalloteichus tenebrarius]|uniref:Beta-glucosidase n=1 Tax=Streptoalloteichus tenebrarius (strain ATCC 17920 / DSM 40477 / JCM 4838 / CBS 697.72 / NBRC 16177 / NCIMB 11028 / NRRL B-12390 / A12253. 1 / ISP 5477) TaxID=1933 RepID=A0ABT1HUM0_STRSD|nr:glycoside hydrolase family 3 C-terminal domain-containing protein [Streptoalloteichus tenebrarius]MCP2259219.1 beta-glucosidase [Streptoalloteichus tenebrarius]BFF04299.1 glycoside hydrolase family 3 C-terminal domain-containing protein [Streptoalloteichus tenebrarius]
MTEPHTADLEKNLRARLAKLTLERKVRLLTGADLWALHEEPAVGLRSLLLSDGPAGVRGRGFDERDPAASLPSPTALAATWDEARVHALGRLLAAEARRKHVDVLLAPTVNLHRTPYGGRHFECFSEDPFLSGRVGVAYVRGVQSGGVAATVKHFVANDSETERMTLDARIDQRTLREVYLAPFEAIVREAHPWAVMAAYNRLNGTTMTEHPMLREVLKDEWGFDGLVMSDWFATRSVDASGRVGLDLAMPGPTSPWAEGLVAAVRAGRVPESAVDDKVVRLLLLAARVGGLDGIPPRKPPVMSPEEIAGQLRAAAAASFVLARNENNLLPLRREALRRVAVIGPNAGIARIQGGGSANVIPPYAVSPLNGLRAALGEGVEVVHTPGVRTHTLLTPVSTATSTNPATGKPGVLVRFLDAHGAELATDHRTHGNLIWGGSFLPALPDDMFARVRTIEVHARARINAAGDHLVGVAGVGRYWLTVGDRVVFDEKLALPPNADILEGLTRPPQKQVTVPLPAGEVDLVARHEVTARVGGLVTLRLGVEPVPPSDEDGIARAVDLARGADAVVLVVGTTDESESEGIDRDDLALPGRQDDLVRRVLAANPRTVVVVNTGGPVFLPWADQAPAVLLSWLGGQEYGNALADALLGAAEPGGRLPTTWPVPGGPIPGSRPVNGVLEYSEGIHVGYRGWDRANLAPAFCFGHGLGYTSWEYTDLEVGKVAVTGQGIPVRVKVRNTGTRPGREVVQVYLSRPGGSVEYPVRWLAGFATVDARQGASATVEVSLPARAFEHWDQEHGSWLVEPGTYRVEVGRSSRDLRLSAEVEVRAAP